MEEVMKMIKNIEICTAFCIPQVLIGIKEFILDFLAHTRTGNDCHKKIKKKPPEKRSHWRGKYGDFEP